MSLTIGEATAINTILDYWLKLSHDGMGPVTDPTALGAMVDLADRANARLGAGVNGEQVRKAWRRHKTAF